MELDLAGETALVTGAGRGMGAAIAETLAESGATVAVNDVDADRLDDTVAAVEAAGGDALAAPADVTDHGAVGEMVAAVEADLGTVDVLVNNAGGWTTEWFADSTPEQWVRDIELNLHGVLNCTHHVLPGMVEQEHGVVVSIVSDAGRVGEPRCAPYAAAKAGVEGFTRTVATEYGRDGVRANCVSMGTTETPRTAELLAGDTRERVVENYPLGRLGRPADAAAAVCFLASDAAGWVTGQTYPVNGGFTMG